MRRIAIINQKGGVGKTTSAANVSAGLARLGHRVLMVDLDPQSHLTLHFGVVVGDDESSVYNVLADNEPASAAIREVGERLHLLPAQIDLAAAEVELAGVVGRELILREALDPLAERFDFVILDCPPSLGVLTLNGLTAADEVLVPLQPHFLALQGLGKLFETVGLVAQRINPGVKVTGVVICMQEHGTRLAGEVVDNLDAFLSSGRDRQMPWSQARIFSTIIRRNIRLAECPSHGLSIFDYAPGCRGALDYESLARELADALGVETQEAAAESASRFEEEPAVAAAPACVEDSPAVVDMPPRMVIDDRLSVPGAGIEQPVAAESPAPAGEMPQTFDNDDDGGVEIPTIREPREETIVPDPSRVAVAAEPAISAAAESERVAISVSDASNDHVSESDTPKARDELPTPPAPTPVRRPPPADDRPISRPFAVSPYYM